MMKPIFNYTLKKMFRLRDILIYFSILMVPVIIVSLTTRFSGSNESLNAELYNVQAIFFIMSFLWMAGIPFMINLVAHGTGLFAGEESEGTMSLLVMKPVKRYEIVLGKTLGLFVASLTYQFISLVLSLFIFSLLSGMDSDSVLVLLKNIPGIMLYATIISLFFTAFSSAMSVIFKKKIAGLIISLLFVFAAFGIFPAFKGILIINGFYEKYLLYIVDFNYHFGLLFRSCIFFISRNYITLNAMDTVDSFTGNNFLEKRDMDIIYKPGYNSITSEVSYIDPLLLVFIYIIISALLFAFVFNRMNKKDLG